MRTCAIVVGSIVVVSFSLFLAAAVTFGVLENHSTPVSTARAYATPDRSGTVATVTSGPSPTRTASRRPAMTAEQKAYLSDMQAKIDLLAKSTSQVSQLSQCTTNCLSLISNPAWQAQMAIQLGTWQAMYEASKDVTPPSGLEIINGKWIETLGHYNLAADDFSRGIDGLNDALMTQGAGELSAADNGINELGQLLSAFKAQHN